MTHSIMKTIFIHTMVILALSLGLSVTVLAADFATTKLKAEQGYDDSQYRLGVMYEAGKGVAKNKVEAQEWYQIACNNDYAKGCKAYDRLNVKELRRH